VTKGLGSNPAKDLVELGPLSSTIGYFQLCIDPFIKRPNQSGGFWVSDITIHNITDDGYQVIIICDRRSKIRLAGSLEINKNWVTD
jgi:hypothetical protein